MAIQALTMDPATMIALFLRRQAERRLERAEQMTAPATRVTGLSRAEMEAQIQSLRRSAAELRRSANQIDAETQPLLVLDDREDIAA